MALIQFIRTVLTTTYEAVRGWPAAVSIAVSVVIAGVIIFFTIRQFLVPGVKLRYKLYCALYCVISFAIAAILIVCGIVFILRELKYEDIAVELTAAWGKRFYIEIIVAALTGGLLNMWIGAHYLGADDASDYIKDCLGMAVVLVVSALAIFTKIDVYSIGFLQKVLWKVTLATHIERFYYAYVTVVIIRAAQEVILLPFLPIRIASARAKGN
jgi:hypothetical protein